MKLKRILIAVVLIALAGGFILLATHDLPVRTTEVRKTIPNDHFLGN